MVGFVRADGTQGGGRTETGHHQILVRVLVHRGNGVGDAVGADFLGIAVADFKPRAHTGADDERRDGEVLPAGSI